MPADDLVWLDAALTPADAFAQALKTGHSRFPVGEGSLDRVSGVVHLRDLARSATGGEPTPIGQLCREVHVRPARRRTSARCCASCASATSSSPIVADEYGARSAS